jgi:glycosyltransferase involved in cell wall biosynthesis
MRILMLAPHPGVRGPLPKHTPVLIDALGSLGCDIAFEPWGRHTDEEGAAQKVIGRARDVARIRRHLQSRPFDVMVVKTSHEARSLLRDLPLLLRTRRTVPRIVVQFHGGRSDLLVAPRHYAFKAATAATFALSDGVLVLSSEEARDCHRFWPRVRVRVVSNPFAGRGEQDPRQLSRNGGPHRPLSLLFVGRLIPEKGIFETLTAFAAISDRHRCRLVVVGDGPQAAALAQRAADLGVLDRVAFKGFLEGEPLEQVYRTADIFVFPSYREGFPTALTEAMAAGLPVVTTRTRGMADHLTDNVNALLVSPRDTVALTAALESLVTDADMRHRMSVANVTKVTEFSPQRVAVDYLATLRELVEADTDR